MSIERQAAHFLVDIADAVAAIQSGKTDYGEFYVSEIRIAFEGDDTGYRIVPNDFGDFDIAETSTTPKES